MISKQKDKMRRTIAKFYICSVLFLATALYATAQTVKPEPDLKGRYHAIEVTKFEVAQDVDIPENQINVLMLEIVDEMYKLKKFDQIINPTAKTTSIPVSTTQPTIRLLGTFTKYFALIPEKDTMQGGEIWTHVRVKVRFIDAADGRLLLEKDIDRRIFFGTYQFYLRDVTRKAAQEIARITKKTFF